MPVRFRRLCAAVVMLAASASPLSANAEFSEADKAGKNAFMSCLGEAGESEDTCLVKLGRYAWYPRDDATCEAVGARVHAAITDVNQAEWRDLFFNERCARLGLSNDMEATLAGNRETPDRDYAQCVEEIQSPSICAERLGRHRQYPTKPDFCYFNRDMIELTLKREKLSLSWKELFENERCQRLQMPYFEQNRY